MLRPTRWVLVGSYPCSSFDRATFVAAACKQLNGDIKPGRYRPIDLAQPPFGLPPARIFDEAVKDGKHLYLYRRTELAAALLGPKLQNLTTKLPRTTLGTGLARTGTNTGTPKKE